MRLAFNVVVAWLAVYLVWQARAAMAPFVLGLLAAYIVLPAVNWLDGRLPARLRRGKLGRTLAIIAVYAVTLGLIVAFFALLVPVIVAQAAQLIASRAVISAAIEARLAALRSWYFEAVPIGVRQAIEGQSRAAGDQLIKALQAGIVGGVVTIGNVLVVVFGYLVVPFWLFFVLYSAPEYRQELVALIPGEALPDAHNTLRIVDDVLGAYIRGQLVVASMTGVLTTIALSLLGVNYSALLGFVSLVGDLIPTMGAILAAIPTVLIAAVERPILGLWALLALLGVQQFESTFLGPRVVGGSVRVSPALIIFLLVVGGELWGLLGLVAIVPLFALARDLVRYVNLRTAGEGLPPDAALERVRQQRRRQVT